KINNCNINNFAAGLDLSTHFSTSGNGWGSIWQVTHYSQNIIVNNNLFENNNYGINTDRSRNDLIKNNEFKNNQYGISLTSITSNIVNNSFINNDIAGINVGEAENINIWANIFEGKGINFKSTKNVKFCKNNLSNIYLGDLNGVNCNCIVPHDGLNIDSAVKFCKGKYFLPKGINLKSNGKLDCNNAEIFGNKSSYGISVYGGSGTLINNCVITNYKTGVIYSSSDVKNIYGNYNTYISSNNKIYNSKILDVNNGIIMNKHTKGDSLAENIHNTTILATNYSIYNNVVSIINASNNIWGSNDLDEIESKFLDKNKIIYQPFIKVNLDLDLEILNEGIYFLPYENNISKTKIRFIVSKNNF
ncbi:MAG: hypothetical protein KC589_11335, partial [Nanoarchaeota archaeon]|nr:hypothetical protein [Nanoarchaeota archaeon]